jgi:hypothetical protein
MGKPMFSVDQFKDMFEQYVKDGIIQNQDVDFVLITLFNFSIIGNEIKGSKRRIFRYEKRDARISMNDPLVIHQGLYKALQLF